MGKMKELFMEDYEKAAELDRLYIMADDSDWEREFYKETEIEVTHGRKKKSDVREVEIKLKRPRFIKSVKRPITPIY